MSDLPSHSETALPGNALAPACGTSAVRPTSDDSWLEREYAAHASYVFRCLQVLGIPGSEVEDAVQEVFVILYRRGPNLDWSRSLRPWLFGVCRRVAARERTRSAKQRRNLHLLQSVQPPLASAPSGELGDATRLLSDSLARMSPAKREVFVMSEIHEMTGPEIAGALNLPVNTVFSRLRLARKALEADLHRLDAKEDSLRSLRERRHERVRNAKAELSPSPEQRRRAWMITALAVRSHRTALVARGLLGTGGVIVASLLGSVAAFGASGSPRPTSPIGSLTEIHAITSMNPVAARDAVDRAESLSELPNPVGPAPTVVHERLTTGRSPRGVTPKAIENVSHTGSLRVQTQLLGAAHTANESGRYEEALAQIHDYRQRFDDEVFADECDRLEARALCGLGRAEEARRRFDAGAIPNPCREPSKDRVTDRHPRTEESP